MQNELILVVLSCGVVRLLAEILSTGRLVAHLLHLVLCQRLLLLLVWPVDRICHLSLEMHRGGWVAWNVYIL